MDTSPTGPFGLSLIMDSCCAPKIATAPSLWMEGEALAQIERVAALPHVVACFGMPDLHPGKGAPIGSCIITESGFYPHLAGNDLGCGVRLSLLPPGAIKPARVAKIDLKAWERSDDSALLSEAREQAQEEHGGSARALGTIGGGNHFFEIGRIAEIMDPEQARAHGIEPGCWALLTHSGSRSLGEALARRWTDARAAGFGEESDPFCADWLAEHDRALRFARRNRELIEARFLDLLGSPDATLLLDAWHNGIERLAPPDAAPGAPGRYAHRKGAASSEAPLAALPSARGKPSFLLRPLEGAKLFGSSLAHGAGRKWKRSDCQGRLARFTPEQLLRDGAYRALVANKDLAYEEAAQAYKDARSVLEALTSNGLASAIAQINPILTIKA